MSTSIVQRSCSEMQLLISKHSTHRPMLTAHVAQDPSTSRQGIMERAKSIVCDQDKEERLDHVLSLQYIVVISVMSECPVSSFIITSITTTSDFLDISVEYLCLICC